MSLEPGKIESLTSPDPGTLTYENLLHLLGEESEKCISCGFCDSVCPTYPASGYDPIITARGRAQLGKKFFDDLMENGISQLSVSDSFYSCLDCHACVQVCPTGVDAGRVSDLAKGVMASGKSGMKKSTKPISRMIVAATMRYNNPLGVREKCADWADGLTFEKDSDTLLYTGNMYQLMAYSRSMKNTRDAMGEGLSNAMAGMVSRIPSLLKFGTRRYDEEIMAAMQRNLRNIVYLLERSGLKFSYMGKEEPYSGTFLYDLGYVAEFREYANRIHNMFKNSAYRRIITVDPHTYELLKFIYPKFVEDFGLEVYHYLDFMDSTRMTGTGTKTVFHEPCHFVLSAENYNRPKEILSAISKMTLPERSGKRTFCCGGPNELLFGDLSDRISSMRFKQLKEAHAEKIVTACPICYVNLAKDHTVYDISDIIRESFR